MSVRIPPGSDFFLTYGAEVGKKVKKGAFGIK